MSNCSLTFSPAPATHFAPVSHLHQPRQKPNILPPTTLSPPPLPASSLFHLPVLQILPAAHPSSPSTSHLSPGRLQLHPAASPILSYFLLTFHLAASVIFQKCKYRDFPGGPVVKTTIPRQGTKIPYAAQYGRTKPKQQ